MNEWWLRHCLPATTRTETISPTYPPAASNSVMMIPSKQQPPADRDELPRYAVVELTNPSNTTTLTNVLKAMGYKNIELVCNLQDHSSTKFALNHTQIKSEIVSSDVLSRAAYDLLTGANSIFDDIGGLLTIATDSVQPVTEGVVVGKKRLAHATSQSPLSTATTSIQKVTRLVNRQPVSVDPALQKNDLDEGESSGSSALSQLFSSNNMNVVECKMCKNKIMNSRMSNLTNHVKRHAVKKQFACAFCPAYQHNEQAKVRLHMANKHNNTSTAPVDNLDEELERTWDLLMTECFPEYADRSVLSANRPQTDQDYSPSAKRRHLQEMQSCIECGEVIETSESIQRLEGIEAHLKERHGTDCIAYQCDACGYANAKEYTVRFHICRKHSDKDVTEITVSPVIDERRFSLSICKFFPSLADEFIDQEEEQMKASVSGFEALADPISDITNTSLASHQRHDNVFNCELCQMQINLNNAGIGELLGHAKTHNIKTLETDSSDVTSKDMRRTAWLKSIQLCFPKLANLSLGLLSKYSEK